jgi:coatomer protein complex subunit gamma
MIYLSIKELAVSAEDVIMVTSSIMKDMQPNSEVIYRPNAIRALCRIIDVCPTYTFVYLRSSFMLA